MIFTIFLKAVEVSAEYIIDKIRPEMICNDRVIPSRKPKFQRKEIDEGVGRSIRAFFIIFRMGLVFVS